MQEAAVALLTSSHNEITIHISTLVPPDDTHALSVCEVLPHSQASVYPGVKVSLGHSVSQSHGNFSKPGIP